MLQQLWKKKTLCFRPIAEAALSRPTVHFVNVTRLQIAFELAPRFQNRFHAIRAMWKHFAIEASQDEIIFLRLPIILSLGHDARSIEIRKKLILKYNMAID